MIQAEEYTFMERIQVIQAFFTFATSCLEEECRRRVEAINALTALCCLQKARHLCCIRFEQEVKLLSVLDLPGLPDSISIKYKATQCNFCLGKEGIPAVTRLKSFHSRCTLKKHIQRKYFQHHSNSKPIAYPHPRCYVELRDKMHLQNHAALVHKTLT